MRAVNRSYLRRLGVSLIAAFAAWAMVSFAFPVTPVPVGVRWMPGLTDPQRIANEHRLKLLDGQQTDPSTAPTSWSYLLAAPSTGNIRALVEDPDIQDTGRVDRHLYRPAPELPWTQRMHSAIVVVASLLLGLIAFVLVPVVHTRALRRHAASLGSAMWADVMSAMASTPGTPPPPRDDRITAAVLLGGMLISAAMATLAGASLMASAGALLIVYAGGYVTGSLLIASTPELSYALIRTVSGLMLTSVGFLFSLVLHLPWFIIPAALLVTAVLVRRRTVFAWPRPTIRIGWDGIIAACVAAILMAPVGMAFMRMGGGPYPAVFYNVDSAYSMEKVHALTIARVFPPPSLSNLGVTRTYHYGVHAMAAMISRGSGLLPHQALFLIVLPLLVCGTVAAAVAAARRLAPVIPLTLAVPLLLVSAPTLARSFSDGFGSRLWAAMTVGPFTLDWLNADYVRWGFLSNEAQNTDFLIVGAIAAIAAAPSVGWTLAAFLIGTSVLFKTTTGVALVAGFILAEAWRVIVSRQYRPTGPMLLTGLVFAVTFGAFFLASFDSAMSVRLYPFDHIRAIIREGRPVTPRGFFADSLWVFLPALIVVTLQPWRTGRGSTPYLLMAAGPLIVVNMSHLVHVRDGGMGAGPEDWFQVARPVPFMAHAFALSLANRHWHLLGAVRRYVFLTAIAIALAPVVIGAEAYSSRFLRTPESGHEFVDNRPIAQALSVIPRDGSIVVTNDLRYPADNFGRDDRQMQIPAVFGHQAFSANFSYEPVEDRRPLQRLLQQPAWSDAILSAAREHRWTHFLVRKDYVHPSPIPLERIFENDTYVVYRFP